MSAAKFHAHVTSTPHAAGAVHAEARLYVAGTTEPLPALALH